jgi:hypothetical protein
MEWETKAFPSHLPIQLSPGVKSLLKAIPDVPGEEIGPATLHP